MEEVEEARLTAISSSRSTVRPGLRTQVSPGTLHIHQRWRTVWPARTASTPQEDTSGLPGVTSGTSRPSRPSRRGPTLRPLLEDTRLLTRLEVRLEDSQGDSQGEVTSAGELAVVTTAPASPATAPASVWWGSARRSTTTGPPAWSSPRQELHRATTQT